MQAWQNAALSSGSSSIQAAEQAGESDKSQYSDSLVYFGRHGIFQALVASIIHNDKNHLQDIRLPE